MTRIVCILAFISMVANMNAQGLEISVHADPQLSWITSDESGVNGDGAILGLNTGLEFDIFFMPHYAFTFGVDLNNQGGKIVYSDSINFQQTNGTLEIPAGSSLKHNLQYLGVPLGLKLKTAELGYTTFYVHGGLAPLFNVRATTSSDPLLLVRENIKPEVHVFSMNYFIAAGIEYRLAGNTAIIFGFRWSAGFNDVTDNDFANNNLNSAGLNLGMVF
ncbi:MAG: porin family protein [Bacteroidales bacterium]|nr:porin family protein [Bacteroidales bacterium]MDT8431436.1 porin family protein [Bacteroidales bacterium]